MRSISVRPTLLVTCAIFLSCFTLGCVTDRSVIDSASDMDKTLKPAEMNDAELQRYLQSIGERIIASAKEADAQKVGPKTHFDKKQKEDWMFSQNMQFHFVNSKTLNAFTTGGEHMYVYNELFQECQSEDELAAVMSHEYAHVYCRHVAQGQQHQWETLIGGAVVGGAAGYALGGKDNGLEYAATGAGVGAGAGQFLNMGFTRKDEAQADQYGFYFYTHAGWSPQHFGDFFQHMIDKGYDKTPAMASDHPTLASRVVEANKRVKALPPESKNWARPPIADAQKFKQLQQRAADLSKRMPDDSHLQNSQQLLQALPRSCVAPVDPQDAIDARQKLAQKAQTKQSK